MIGGARGPQDHFLFGKAVNLQAHELQCMPENALHFPDHHDSGDSTDSRSALHLRSCALVHQTEVALAPLQDDVSGHLRSDVLHTPAAKRKHIDAGEQALT